MKIPPVKNPEEYQKFMNHTIVFCNRAIAVAKELAAIRGDAAFFETEDRKLNKDRMWVIYGKYIVKVSMVEQPWAETLCIEFPVEYLFSDSGIEEERAAKERKEKETQQAKEDTVRQKRHAKFLELKKEFEPWEYE